MALKQFEAVGAFSRVPYDDSAHWEMGPCSGCDWHVLDLFGEAPETVLLHSGTLEVAGDLSLDTPDGHGYYVIEGSLIVHGILKVEIDEAYNVIVVTENLHAQALVVAWETQLYVLGNTTVTGPLLSDLSDGGACYLNGKTVAEGLFDVGKISPWLGYKPDVPRMEIDSRYSSENCEDPMAKMLEDLRAGRALTLDIDQVLNVEQLRGRCLEHSRRAYRLLPPLEQPRILDIGCGQGQQTAELARLSGGEVVGIDIDQAALSRLRQRIDQAGLGDRIKAIHVSLFDNGFDDDSFDLLWEEGVLHLLDASRSLPECRRLLKPGGYLVMHETIVWFESAREKLPEYGFELMDQHMLPKHFWWTDYGAPLEERIRVCRETYGDAADSPKLAAHENVVASIKNDPDRTDCGIYLVQKHD